MSDVQRFRATAAPLHACAATACPPGAGARPDASFVCLEIGY